MFNAGDYPPVAFYFKVSFATASGISDTSFQDVSGISAEIETETVEEGGENRFKYQLPKAVKHPNLVLKRGITTLNSPLAKWCKNVFDGEFLQPITPTSVNVYLMDADQNAVCAWTFANAYPVKWDVSSFNSTKNEVVIETIELTYSYSERIT